MHRSLRWRERAALRLVTMMVFASLVVACVESNPPGDGASSSVRLTSAEVTMPRSLATPLPGPGDRPPDAIDVSLTTPLDSPARVQPTPSDAALKDAIVSRIANDPKDIRSPITVAVDNRMVTLTGTVDSPMARQLAYRYAWVPGVLAVDAQPIRVRDGQAPAPKRDGELERQVAMALAADPAQRDSLFEIQATPGGTVTLSGKVKSHRALARAIQAVSTVPGITIFVDHLQVDWALPPRREGEVIPNLVSLLTWDPRLDGALVRAQAARDGTVRLSGTVRLPSEAKAAVDDAYAAGAARVVDDVKVIPNATPTNPR